MNKKQRFKHPVYGWVTREWLSESVIVVHIKGKKVKGKKVIEHKNKYRSPTPIIYEYPQFNYEKDSKI